MSLSFSKLIRCIVVVQLLYLCFQMLQELIVGITCFGAIIDQVIDKIHPEITQMKISR